MNQDSDLGLNEETPTNDREEKSRSRSLAGSEISLEEAAESHENTTFDDLPLAEEVKSVVAKAGWTKPTLIQAISIPLTTKGRDLAGFAQTGTGKTGVFLLSWMEKVLRAKKEGGEKGFAVTLVPTRELAMQIEADAKELIADLDLSIVSVFGGIDYDKQAQKLKDNPDLIVATPGRLKDYHSKKIIDLGKCQLFICDEADRMLDMGFIEDVEYFLEKIPEDTQKLLFSATTNDSVKELAFEYLNNPEYIFANPEQITPENIVQEAIHCAARDKVKVLLGLYRDLKPEISVIFVNTKLVAEWLHFKLEKNGVDVDIITGDLPQRKRIRLIKNIKAGKLNALIATDVASRGLHIANLSHVFNFDLPDDPSNYIHRVGRTARAGAKGFSVSLVCEDYGPNLEPIKELLGDNIDLESKWAKSEWLEIEDKSPNPYAEGQKLARSTTSTKPAPKRAGASSGEGERQRQGRGPGKGRGKNEGRGRGGPNKQGQGRQQNKNRNRNNQKKRGPKPHQKGPGRQGPPQAAAARKPAEEGVVKKFFKAIFGRKS